MAQETLSGGPLEDTDLMKKFLGNDAHILTDLQSYRSGVDLYLVLSIYLNF